MRRFESINVIPFIDIMLVLLAIVLMTASFIQQGKLKVALPEASSSSPAQADQQARIITINASGEIYFDDKAIEKPALSLALKALTTDTPIDLKVDKQTDFGVFVTVIDLLKENNLDNLSVITTESKGS